MVDADPLLLRKWALKYAEQTCSMVWEDDDLCRIFMESGFVNWGESWSKRDSATKWCQNYSACPKTKWGLFGATKVDNCTACKDFFGDFINVAKTDEKLFHDIFIQYGKDTCHGVYQEAGCNWVMSDPRIEKIVRDGISKLTGPDDVCKEATFC